MMSRITDDAGGPVHTDVSYFRDTEYLVYFTVCSGVTCHQCGSGEVYQPMQTLDMPMNLRCLSCGAIEPSGNFDTVNDD